LEKWDEDMRSIEDNLQLLADLLRCIRVYPTITHTRIEDQATITMALATAVDIVALDESNILSIEHEKLVDFLPDGGPEVSASWLATWNRSFAPSKPSSKTPSQSWRSSQPSTALSLSPTCSQAVHTIHHGKPRLC